MLDPERRCQAPAHRAEPGQRSRMVVGHERGKAIPRPWVRQPFDSHAAAFAKIPDLYQRLFAGKTFQGVKYQSGKALERQPVPWMRRTARGPGRCCQLGGAAGQLPADLWKGNHVATPRGCLASWIHLRASRSKRSWTSFNPGRVSMPEKSLTCRIVSPPSHEIN